MSSNSVIVPSQPGNEELLINKKNGNENGNKSNNGKTNNGKTNNGKTNNGKTNNGKTNNGKTNNNKCPPPTPDSIKNTLIQMAERLKKAGDVAAARFFEMAATTIERGVRFSKTLKAGIGKAGKAIANAATSAGQTLKSGTSKLTSLIPKIKSSNIPEGEKKTMIARLKSMAASARNAAKSGITAVRSRFSTRKTNNAENNSDSAGKKASMLARLAKKSKNLSNATRKAIVGTAGKIKEASGKLAHTMKSSAALAGRGALAVGATAAYGAKALGSAAVGSVLVARNKIRNTYRRYNNERKRVKAIRNVIYGMTPAQLERLKSTLGPAERRAITQARSGSTLNNLGRNPNRYNTTTYIKY